MDQKQNSQVSSNADLSEELDTTPPLWVVLLSVVILALIPGALLLLVAAAVVRGLMGIKEKDSTNDSN